MTRDEAQSPEETRPTIRRPSTHDFDYIATKLGISVAELRLFPRMPLKTHPITTNRGGCSILGGVRALKAIGVEKVHQAMIAIVDSYGSGNVAAIADMFKRLNCPLV